MADIEGIYLYPYAMRDSKVAEIKSKDKRFRPKKMTSDREFGNKKNFFHFIFYFFIHILFFFIFIFKNAKFLRDVSPLT